MFNKFIFFLVLFAINNALHLVSEKVVILIFILFVFFIMKLVGEMVKNEHESKLIKILHDVNEYMNSVFSFLYSSKLFYFNVKSFSRSLVKLLKNIA